MGSTSLRGAFGWSIFALLILVNAAFATDRFRIDDRPIESDLASSVYSCGMLADGSYVCIDYLYEQCSCADCDADCY